MRSGERVAIKLLRHENDKNAEMLGSFRRGVQSMRILADNGISGMVRYRNAYDISPCVIMDYVDGPNLQQAMERGLLTDWNDKLRVARDVAQIVRSGHNLAARVLHRDIRPANIMLRDFYSTSGTAGWEVVVLDFDLSYHRGAMEQSIDLRAQTGLGYLAPEQLQEIKGVSTRHSAVDSFGLGMTMSFLFTGEHPRPGAHAKEIPTAEFARKLDALGDSSRVWRSLPVRIARLIARSTCEQQKRRLDMGQVVAELGRLYIAASDPGSVTSAELWAEECLYRAFPNRDYQWDSDRLKGRIDLVSGLAIELKGDESAARVNLELSWDYSGGAERRNVSKYLIDAAAKCESTLRKAGFTIKTKNNSADALHLEATVTVHTLRQHCDKAAKGVADIAPYLEQK